MTAIDIIDTLEELKNDKQRDRIVNLYLEYADYANNWDLVDLLEDFLERHAATMPRTVLKYAIEQLPETRRRYFMVTLKMKKQPLSSSLFIGERL